MDFEDRYFLRRIRHTFVAITFVYVGGTMIRISVLETFRTFWGIPVFVVGGVLFARGLGFFNIAQNLRQPLNRNGPVRVGIPLGPEERVGIPLAPEERGDPELEIEGLLLHHDLNRIWPQRRNGVEPPVAVNDDDRDGIGPEPAEGDPEMAGLLLNDPQQALNLIAEAGIEEAEGNGAMQLQEVAVREDILLPLAEGDPEEAVVGLVLNDPPQDLNFIDEAGIEEVEDDDAMQVQEVAVENDVRVDILLPPAEGEPAMVGVELNDPPQALNLRDEAVIEQGEGNNAMQLQAVVVDNSVRMDIRPAAVEEVEWAMEAIALDDLLEGTGGTGAEQGASSDVEQAQEAIDIDRVGIHLSPDETRDSSLLAEGLILHQDSSQINASAVYLKKEDVVPCLESEKEKKSPIEEATPQMDKSTPQLEEPTPQLEEPTPQLEEPTPQLEEPTPQLEEQSPKSDEQSPKSDEQSPKSDEQSPQSEEQMPVQPGVMLDQPMQPEVMLDQPMQPEVMPVLPKSVMETVPPELMTESVQVDLPRKSDT